MAVTRVRVLGGRYALRRVIGTGGMATVWQATDQVLGREVAVKVLSSQFAADPDYLARFDREARHAAALSHPGLVTVFDSGMDGAEPFIVMELVTGRTLRQVLDEAGILPAGQAVEIAAAVCEALQAAHSAGLVHRDIKPGNIMLTSDGQVKLLDLGIARAEGATRTATVLGTAAYLSPEQASGQPAGPRADLYSLGCVLFEMLTGAPPFSADTAVAVAYRQVHDDPGLPSARRPGLPARLDWVTTQLLAKDPAARPSSAAAARAGLLAVLTADTTAVLPGPFASTASDLSAGPRRQRPRAIVAVLAVALAVTVAALAVVLLTGDPWHPAAAALAHSTSPPAAHKRHARPAQRATRPPVAAAAAAFVGDLQAAAADGQVTPHAGQDLFGHLQQL
ncbi:MAG TPA: protein kinase, partial [Streptosporangiaceae bacterium]|nr:protein kinase [Streptosporangiaceae bacterium]